MLSSSEIELLSNIANMSDSGVPVFEISDALSWSEGHTSRVVSGLEDRDFLRTEREGGKRLVLPNDIPPVEQLGDLAQEYAHVDFPGLISGSALSILYYLDESRTARELAELCGVSRNTVYRRLNSLQNVGIVKKDHSKYQLTEAFRSLSKLSRSIAHHEHRQEALDFTNGVSIVWETHDEYLFSCEAPISGDQFLRTGPSEYEQFGIPLFTRERLHYIRPKRLSELTPADLVCHTLLIDDSTRYRSYCLLLIEAQQVDQSTLNDRAGQYDPEAEIDLTARVKELIAYLESDGSITNDTLPRWEDFKSAAADYDISV